MGSLRSGRHYSSADRQHLLTCTVRWMCILTKYGPLQRHISKLRAANLCCRAGATQALVPFWHNVCHFLLDAPWGVCAIFSSSHCLKGNFSAMLMAPLSHSALHVNGKGSLCTAEA